jgi:hypothetical protein
LKDRSAIARALTFGADGFPDPRTDSQLAGGADWSMLCQFLETVFADNTATKLEYQAAEGFSGEDSLAQSREKPSRQRTFM